VLNIDADGALGASSGTITMDGGTIRFGSAVSVSNRISLGSGGGTFDTSKLGDFITGNITGSGGLSKIGSGSISLSGTNTYTGATSIHAGTLGFAPQSAPPNGTFSVDGGASLHFSFGVTVDNLTGSGSSDFSDMRVKNADFSGRASSFRIQGVSLGKLTVVTGGTAVFSGVNDWDATTIESGGTLQLGKGGAASSSPAPFGPIQDNGTLLINCASAVTIPVVISGQGVVQISGTGTTTLGRATSIPAAR
jgi:fibronectin-binding autotransporter adhesin